MPLMYLLRLDQQLSMVKRYVITLTTLPKTSLLSNSRDSLDGAADRHLLL